MQALPALPESLSIVEMGTAEGGGGGSGENAAATDQRTLGALYLNIGLQVWSPWSDLESYLMVWFARAVMLNWCCRHAAYLVPAFVIWL